MKPLFLVLLSGLAFAQAPQYPVLPGGSGGGAVSSVFGRTGAVTAGSGDYTASQVTGAEQTANKDAASGYAGLDSATKLKYAEWPTGNPQFYYCPTSAYSDPAYTCSTGASLSTVPPTGTLILADLLQACTDSLVNILTIDNLAGKQMFWPDGGSFVKAYCSSGNTKVLLQVLKISSSNFTLTVVGTGGIEPFCPGTAGGVLYNNSLSATCDANLLVLNNTTQVKHLVTETNCSSAASPAVCGTAAAGSVVVAAGATTVVVNTTQVTANSQIFISYDSSLGTKLSVTCNTTEPALFGVTARTAATSFTITATSPVTNPACFSYFIVN